MIRSWIPKLLYRRPWPISTAVAPEIDCSTPTEEEVTPLYHPDRFYPITLGQVLNERYQVATKLGYGGNSTVWLCRDLNQFPVSPIVFITDIPKTLGSWLSSRERYVAVKVNALHHPGANRLNKGELDIMQHTLRANPQHHGWPCVRKLLDSFKLEGRYGTHECLVMEPMLEPLWRWQHHFDGGVIPPNVLKPILQMTLTGLDYLHSECRVVHGDMKPGNLMMTTEDANVFGQSAKDEFSRKVFGPLERPGIIQISDFDTSSRTRPDKVNMGPVGAKIFRAPEIILNAGYTYPADIWSLGTMLWYLLENKDLFDPTTHGADEYNEQSHLGQITALLGPPPQDLLSEGERTSNFYEHSVTTRNRKKHTSQVRYTGQLKDPGCVPDDFTFESSITCMEGEEKGKFIRFIKRMMKWDPDERATASELLEDPWLNQDVSGD
ncbi:hypothetical protein NW768_007740 [Fusarium equiseti]|uniref:non-specific serine/threonine protein kinase n=1 Tax=Fusarium equiseti TaxID=61235 RepID=A0ABQ8R8X7_FUSEQ|nr:hypothetical protein NW768_007740 [Fusarium equiseti]